MSVTFSEEYYNIFACHLAFKTVPGSIIHIRTGFAPLTFRHGPPLSQHVMKGRPLNQKSWFRQAVVLSLRTARFGVEMLKYVYRTDVHTSDIFYYWNGQVNVIQFCFKHFKILLILLADCFNAFYLSILQNLFRPNLSTTTGNISCRIKAILIIISVAIFAIILATILSVVMILRNQGNSNWHIATIFLFCRHY